MRAIVLAGGKGRRLMPYTMSFPKPLVPVGERPILETVVRQLRRRGFTRVTISTGHLAGLIEAYFGDGSAFDVAIDYVREDTPLNTAGALSLLPDPDETMLVLNGDVLTDLDFAEFLRAHEARGAWASVATNRRTQLVDFGVVHCDDGGRLTAWVEKPETSYQVSMGVYAVSRRALGLLEKGEPLGMPNLLLRVVAAGGEVWCHEHPGYWLDIGRPEDYEQAQADVAKHPEIFGDDA